MGVFGKVSDSSFQGASLMGSRQIASSIFVWGGDCAASTRQGGARNRLPCFFCHDFVYPVSDLCLMGRPMGIPMGRPMEIPMGRPMEIPMGIPLGRPMGRPMTSHGTSHGTSQWTSHGRLHGNSHGTSHGRLEKIQDLHLPSFRTAAAME